MTDTPDPAALLLAALTALALGAAFAYYGVRWVDRWAEDDQPDSS